MAKCGRKRIEIDWVQFEKLCEIQASLEEIALWFGCSVDTIERAVKREFNCNFADHHARKSVKGKIAIKRQLMQMALANNRNSIPVLLYCDRKYNGGGPLPDGTTQVTSQVQVQTNIYGEPTKETRIQYLREALGLPIIEQKKELVSGK